MNQILSVESTKKQKRQKNHSGPIEIKSIIKFFTISIMIFGIFIVSSGSYSMYKELQSENSNAKPTISVEQSGNNKINLKISHEKGLSKVTYNWDNDKEVEISTNGKKSIETEIEIPKGKSALKIYAVDKNGQASEYQQIYKRDIAVDFKIEGTKVKVIVDGKNDLSYMTYRWDNNEETKVEINDIKREESIEIPKGLHKLTIIVVDINNNTETVEQEIKGVTKPIIDVSINPEQTQFIIKLTDEEGLNRVEFKVDETISYDQNLEGKKEALFSYPLHEGETKLETTLYNINNVSENSKVLFRK